YVKRRQRNRRRRVSTHRLHQHAFPCSMGQLLAQRVFLFDVGHRPDAVRRNQRAESSDRLLQHRSLAGDIQKLFGSFASAARPESGSTSARKNHRMNRNCFARHVNYSTTTSAIWESVTPRLRRLLLKASRSGTNVRRNTDSPDGTSS